MAKPLVAIVGRPNVGKSTFFNKIAGRRISIVEDVPGVTRDRIYCDVEWMGRYFSMVDTGGLDMRSEDVLLSQMRRQAEIAMETADVICFFCDGRTGLTPDDEAFSTVANEGEFDGYGVGEMDESGEIVEEDIFDGDGFDDEE